MPSGLKTVVINTQERAISTDINRLQAFAGAGLGELIRYWLVVSGSDDLNAGAIATEQTSLTSPLTAQIINGLLVRPQVANLSLLVDPGVIVAIAPDFDPDSSPLKIIKDTGITGFGVLPMTAGVIGGTRIDIIEVQVGTTVTENDSRDEFNPSTGLFAPVTVPKARQGNVTGTGNIRVRQGSPGGGFPGVVAGWLPLAVASVPTTATSCDQMTFWDVRPLINDLAFGMSNLSSDKPGIRPGQINALTLSNARGKVEAVLNNRRVGGRLRRGSAGTDGEFIDLTAAANQENSFTPTVGIWSIYLCTPFGLPGWRRYTDATVGSRVPRSPRGIPVVSMVGPDPDGRPTGPLSLPPSLGLGAPAAVQTNEAVAVASSYVSNAPGPSAVALPFTLDGYFIQVAFTTATNNNIVQTNIGISPQTFTFVPNRDYPAHAKRLAMIANANGTASGAFSGDMHVNGFDAGATSGTSFITYVAGIQTQASTAFQVIATVNLPVPGVYPSRVPLTQSYQLVAAIANSVAYSMGPMGWYLA